MARVGGIILAAGRAARFQAPDGGHKLLAPVHGLPLVRLSVSSAVAAAAHTTSLADIVVVTGYRGAAVQEALRGLPVRIVHAEQYAEGMAASLRCGLTALGESVDAVVVALGDQPGVRPEAYARVIGAWRRTERPIVVPRYAGPSTPNHPVLFAAGVFPELRLLQGDAGARAVIARDPRRVHVEELEWTAPGDVDVAGDVALVTAQLDAAAGRGLGGAAHRSGISTPNADS